MPLNPDRTIATDPLRNFRFLVQLNKPVGGTSNWNSLAFASVSGLAIQNESIAYREGGDNTVVKQLPGQTQFTPITLTRGVFATDWHAWYWMAEIFHIKQGAGGTSFTGTSFRNDFYIHVLDFPSASVTPDPTNPASWRIKVSFKVYNAWPAVLQFSDLNAGDNSLFVQQLVLQHEGFDIFWGGVFGAAGVTPTFTPLG